MTTSMRRPDTAPLLTAVADPPHATGAAAGVYVTTIVNVALLQLQHPDDAAAARTAPVVDVRATDVRAASGPLIVDGIVFPGLRFGS